MMTDVGSTPVIQTGSPYGEGGGMMNSWWWGFLIIAMMWGWGGNGFGGRGGDGAGLIQQDVYQANQMQSLANSIRDTQNDVWQGQLANTQAMYDAQLQSANQHTQDVQSMYNAQLQSANQHTQDIQAGYQSQITQMNAATENTNAIRQAVNNIGYELGAGLATTQQAINAGFFGLNDAVKDATYANGMTALQNKYDIAQRIDGIQNALQLDNCGLTNAMGVGFASVGNKIGETACGIQRAIEGINFNNERNTAAIVQAGNANTQRIIDMIAANEKARLAEQLAQANQSLSEQRIIAAMKPTAPIPAYQVANPYTGLAGGCC